MDLPSALAVPRRCWLAGQEFWVKPLSLEAWATLLAWLDDVLPGKPERAQPPEISGEEADKALASIHGRTVQIWLALRDQDVTPEVARGIVRSLDESGDQGLVEWVVFRQILFGRRRSLKPSSDGDDPANVWFGPMLCKLMEAYPALTFDLIGKLTLDQLDCLCAKGCEDEDPVHTRLAELDRMVRANREATEKAEAV